MLALRYYGRRDIRLEEIEKPKPADDEILIKVTDAGISQTQINEFIEGPFIINKTPIIPSQEFGGIDESSKKIAAVLPLVTCKECEYCKNGLEQLCPNLFYYGLLSEDGGFAEFCKVKKENLFYLEDETLLTFIEPILVGIHSAHQYERLGRLENKRVLVLGAGAVGLSVASVWRDYFQADVIVVDVLKERVKRANSANIEAILNSEVKGSFEIVVDAAGTDISTNSTFLESFNYLKSGGVLVNIGTYFHPLNFTPSNILLKEQIVLTSILYNKKDVSILDSVLKSLQTDFSKLIEYIELKYILEKGYYAIEIDKSQFTRIVVKPND